MPKVVDVEEQRARVIDAAWQVIVDDGFDGATMRRIAAQAGCTTGLVTHYFKNKDELLLAMVRRSAHLAGERLAEARKEGRGLASVQAIVTASVPIGGTNADEWRIWIALWDQSMANESLRTLWRRRANGWLEMVRDGIIQAVEDGELAPGAPTTQIVEGLAALHYGLSVSSVLTPERVTSEEVVGIIEQYVQSLRSTYPAAARRARRRARAPGA